MSSVINAVGNALTGVTGTGTFVGANTPTLITPNIGAATGASLITTGNLESSAGNVQAGSSGHAGTVSSFPATATKGSLSLTAVASGANYAAVISNASLGQATTWSLPDPGASTANIAVNTGSLTGGNIPQFNSTGGLLQDSGIAASSIATTSTAVLLNPSGAQTINGAYLFTIANGVLNLGQAAGGATEGELRIFPTASNQGSLDLLYGGNSAGNFVTAIEVAASVGQTQIINIPDSGAATATFAVNSGSLTSGHLVSYSGTGGVVQDSGIAASAVATTTTAVLLSPSGTQTISTYGLVVPSINFGGATLSTYTGLQSWTPSVTFATPGDLTVSYVQQTGSYSRIGDIVTVQAYLTFTPTYTTAASYLEVALPFTANNSMNDAIGSVIVTGVTFPAGQTAAYNEILAGNEFAYIGGYGSAVAAGAWTVTQYLSGVQYSIIYSATYLV